MNEITILELYMTVHPEDLEQFQCDVKAVDNRSVNADRECRLIMLRLANKIADSKMFALDADMIYKEIKRIAGLDATPAPGNPVAWNTERLRAGRATGRGRG